MADTVGIRELQQNASEVVRRASSGSAVVITDRGRPVARLVPIAATPLEQLLSEGLVQPATQDPWDLPPPLEQGVGPTLSDLLRDAREHER